MLSSCQSTSLLLNKDIEQKRHILYIYVLYMVAINKDIIKLNININYMCTPPLKHNTN